MKTYDDMDVYDFNKRYKEICDLLNEIVTVSSQKRSSSDYDVDFPPVGYNQYSIDNNRYIIRQLSKKLDKMIKYCLSKKYCLFCWLFIDMRYNREFSPYKIENIEHRNNVVYKCGDKLEKVKTRYAPCDFEFRVIDFWLNNEEANTIERLLIGRAMYKIDKISKRDVKKPKALAQFKELIKRVEDEYGITMNYFVEHGLYTEISRLPRLWLDYTLSDELRINVNHRMEDLGKDIGYLCGDQVREHINEMINTYSSSEYVTHENADLSYVNARLICAKEVWSYCINNNYRLDSMDIAIASKELVDKFEVQDKWQKTINIMLEKSNNYAKRELSDMANSYVSTYNSGIRAINIGNYNDAYREFKKCAENAKWLNHFGIKMDGNREFSECDDELRDCASVLREKSILETAERLHCDYKTAEMYYQQALDRLP